jgi:hypothetical protein
MNKKSPDVIETPAPLSRRFALRGLGGATLALPILPSLLTPSEARAQAVLNQKNYIHFFTEHGSIRNSNMFPTDGAVAERTTVGGLEVRRRPLELSLANGTAVVSPVLSAPSDKFTAALMAKMNVIRGLDIPFGIAHYRGATLGNYAANNGDNSLSASVKSSSPRRTIDQVMAWAPEFYGSNPSVSQRSITACVADPYADAHLSYGYANPATGTGAITHVQGNLDSWALFARLFPSVGTTPTNRAPIVDRVLEQYKRLRNGSRRLSAADKSRLDDYMQRVSEVQRRLTSTAPTCQGISRPPINNVSLRNQAGFATNAAEHAHYYRLITDVVVLALQCGQTRIASLGLASGEHSFSSEISGPEWHDAVAHPAPDNDTAQRRIVAAKNLFFRDVLLDFVSKLDGISTGDGKTLLDKSMVVWMQEHGNMTHQTTSIPVITFGNADGALRSGNYCDYRNMVLTTRGFGNPGEEGKQYFGLVLNQFFGNVLQLMGIPRSAYQETNHNGYGLRPASTFALGDNNNNFRVGQVYPDAIWNAAGQMLPWLGA